MLVSLTEQEIEMIVDVLSEHDVPMGLVEKLEERIK